MESLKPCDFPGNRDLYCAVPSPINLDEVVSPFGRRPLIFFVAAEPPPSRARQPRRFMEGFATRYAANPRMEGILFPSSLPRRKTSV